MAGARSNLRWVLLFLIAISVVALLGHEIKLRERRENSFLKPTPVRKRPPTQLNVVDRPKPQAGQPQVVQPQVTQPQVTQPQMTQPQAEVAEPRVAVPTVAQPEEGQQQEVQPQEALPKQPSSKENENLNEKETEKSDILNEDSPPVLNLDQLRATRFIALRVKSTREYLAAVPVDHGATKASVAEKLWRVFETDPRRDYGPDAFHLRAHSGAFLSADSEGNVNVAKLSARSYEAWKFVKNGDGTYQLTSKHGKFLKADPAHKRGASATGQSADNEASHWEVLVPNCTSSFTCWGFDSPHRPVHLPTESLHPLVLFGNPKEVTAVKPAYKQNPNITFTNWAQLPKVRTILFTNDAATREMAESAGLQVSSSHTIHPKYNESTYANLFDQAFELAPEAEVGAFTNGDIIYTRGIVETLTHVLDQLKALKQPPHKFMIVGQRINVDVPANFQLSPDVQTWEKQIEELAKGGELYQDNAEDYFIVSRALWQSIRSEVPDFIVGGAAFDNWFVALMNRKQEFCVDGTNTIPAIHLNHAPSWERKISHKSAKSDYNVDLAVNHGSWAGGRTTVLQWYTMWDPITGGLRLWKRSGRLLFS